MIKIINVKSGPSKRLIYYVDFLQINDITGICFTTTNRNDIQSSGGEGTLRSPQFQTFFWYISSAMNSLPNSAPITIHGSNTFFKFRSQLQAQNHAFYWCTCFSTYWSLCLLPWRLLFCIYMFSSCNWIVKDRRDGGVFSLKLTLIGPALKTGSKVCSEFHPQFPTCTTECFTCTRNTKHSRQRIQNTCTRNTKHSRHLERIQDQGQTHRLYHVCAFSKTQFLWQHIWQLVNWKQQQWFPNLSKLKRVQPAVLRGNS